MFRSVCKVVSESIAARNPVPLFEKFLLGRVLDPKHFIECLVKYNHSIIGSGPLQCCLGENFAQDVDVAVVSKEIKISAREHSNHTDFMHEAFRFSPEIKFWDQNETKEYTASQMYQRFHRWEKSNCYEFLPCVVTKYVTHSLASRFDYIVVCRKNCASVLDYVDRHNDFKFTCVLFDGKKLKIKYPESIATKDGGICNVSAIPVYKSGKVTKDTDHKKDSWKAIFARRSKYVDRGFKIEIVGDPTCFQSQVIGRMMERGKISRRLSDPRLGFEKYNVLDRDGEMAMQQDFEIKTDKTEEKETKRLMRPPQFRFGHLFRAPTISRRKSTTDLAKEKWDYYAFSKPKTKKWDRARLRDLEQINNNRNLASVF